MYLDYKVNIPDKSGITRKSIKGTTYVYYAYDRKYDPEKKHTVPINTTIGKCGLDDPDMMYPNTNFLKYFPEVEMPDDSFVSIQNPNQEIRFIEIVNFRAN